MRFRSGKKNAGAAKFAVHVAALKMQDRRGATALHAAANRGHCGALAVILTGQKPVMSRAPFLDDRS